MQRLLAAGRRRHFEDVDDAHRKREPLLGVGLNHVERHRRRSDPETCGSPFAMESLRDVEVHHRPQFSLPRDIPETAPAAETVFHEAMGVGRSHRKSLTHAMKRRQRPVPVSLAVDLKPCTRPAEYKRSGGLSDRAYPMEGLLFGERSVLTIRSLSSCGPRPPLLVQHANWRAVRRDGVRVNHLQTARSVKRRSDGAEVFLTLPIR